MSSETRIIHRTPAEKARLKAIREKFQREKPGPDDLIAQGAESMPQGVYLELGVLIHELREERKRAGLSLSAVAKRARIDKAALSRLENGHRFNTTVATLARYAAALGRHLAFSLETAAAPAKKPRASRKRA